MDHVTGLKPFGIDFFCLGRKFLVFNLVDRNLKVKYRRSVVGILWTLLNPIAHACIYYFVFKVVLNVKVPHYLAFIMSGVLAWNFFAQTTLEGIESIVANWSLASKVPIPLQIFPYVGTVTNLVTFAIALPVLLGACLVSQVSLGPSLVLLPVYVGMLFLMTYSLALIGAIGMVYFRDLKHAATLILQIWFYGTPVIYSEAQIPEKYSWIVWVNPMGQLFSGLHAVLVRGDWPTPTQLAITATWCTAFVLTALGLQKYFGRGLVEKL